MGLKNKAVHALLANPGLAPFELVQRPGPRQDWTLIDHLTTIHKVKSSDYVAGESRLSIMNMARRLAFRYVSESAKTRCVVLVKDGLGAQKPAVGSICKRHPRSLHMDFCLRNLAMIEYTAMQLLCNMGMKNKLFLVTGANFGYRGNRREGNSVDNVVSLHREYLEDFQDCGRRQWELHKKYAKGAIERPEGVEGVFVVTFADPDTSQVAVLQEACLRCMSTEADTLLVELGNALEGSVTVCTRDSDLVAVLTACGREGITLRLDNMSYHWYEDMHWSYFGDLFVAIPKDRTPKMSCPDLDSKGYRFRALCDIAVEDVNLAGPLFHLHNNFEAVKCRDMVRKETMAMYLYLGGIRGSIYGEFLARLLSLPKRQILDTVASLNAFVHSDKRKRKVRYIFDYIFRTLCPEPESGLNRSTSHAEKRKAQCLEELDGNTTCSEPGAGRRRGHPVTDMTELKKLNKCYTSGMVPWGSYGRFIRLNHSGCHFFMRMKEEVIRDERVRTAKLFFMMLCGTDYNMVPKGLSLKRLMTGALTEPLAFSSWCQELKRLWYAESPREHDYYKIVMKLARLTRIPTEIQSAWTEVTCSLLVKTMKYVYELWILKSPTPGPEYGFYVHNGVILGHKFQMESPARSPIL